MRIALPASLRHSGYAAWTVCQFIAYLGRWVQSTGLGWLAYQQTHSAVTLGWMAFATFGPLLALGSLGGWLADRVDGKRILGTTQALMLVQSLGLAMLYLSGRSSLFTLLALALFQGCLSAIDAPARQLFYRRILPDSALLPSAITVTSFSYNTSRLVGPAIGGLVAAQLSVGWCFAIAALSCLPMQLASLVLNLLPREIPKQQTSMWEGVRYAVAHPTISRTLAASMAASLLLLPFAQLIPAYVQEAVKGGVGMVGTFSALTGGGAVVASLLQGALASRWSVFTRVVGASAALALGVTALALSGPVVLCGVAFFAVGLTSAVALISTQELLQLQSSPEMRGKVLGLSVMTSYGVLPLGTLLISALATHVGVRTAFGVSAAVFMALMATAWVLRPKQARSAPV